MCILEADTRSDHDWVIMTSPIRLKKARKPNKLRLRFGFERLRDPDVACTFQATICGKFTPPIGLRDEDIDDQYHDYHLQYGSDSCSQ